MGLQAVTRQFASRITVFAAVFSVLSASHACADSNPGHEDIPVIYCDTPGGQQHNVIVTQFGVAYDPNLVEEDGSGWCAANHRTGEGNLFYHAHTSDGFSFQDTTRTPEKTVTAQMSDYYWDQALRVDDEFSKWSRKEGSTSTMTHNCHGYALREDSLWIAHGGSNKVIDDDYTHITSPEVGCVTWWHAPTTDHCTKVLGIRVMTNPPSPFDWVTKHEDKFAASAVYVFEFAVGVPEWEGCWYKKE